MTFFIYFKQIMMILTLIYATCVMLKFKPFDKFKIRQMMSWMSLSPTTQLLATPIIGVIYYSIHNDLV